MFSSTGASKANIVLVCDDEVQMAIVQNDVMDYAYNGTDQFEGDKMEGFSSMAACYAEVCQIIANPDSGIATVADPGRQESVGGRRGLRRGVQHPPDSRGLRPDL